MPYRGSPNWESWAIHAWISNDEPAYWFWKQRSDEVFEECECDDVEEQSRIAQRKLAAELQYRFTEPEAIAGGRSVLATDVTEAELETVDWSHVADNLLSEANYDGIEYICEGRNSLTQKERNNV